MDKETALKIIKSKILNENLFGELTSTELHIEIKKMRDQYAFAEYHREQAQAIRLEIQKALGVGIDDFNIICNELPELEATMPEPEAKEGESGEDIPAEMYRSRM